MQLMLQKQPVWSILSGQHFQMWETISNGEFEVPHFTNKARVDDLVRYAGFKYYTFVQAALLFSKLSSGFCSASKTGRNKQVG